MHAQFSGFKEGRRVTSNKDKKEQSQQNIHPVRQNKENWKTSPFSVQNHVSILAEN